MIELPFENLETFVIWLGTAGAAGFVVAYLLERWAAFQALSSSVKKVIVFLVFAGLPFAAEGITALLSSLSPEALAAAQHYFALLLTGGMAWSVSQYAHLKDRAVRKQTE